MQISVSGLRDQVCKAQPNKEDTTNDTQRSNYNERMIALFRPYIPMFEAICLLSLQKGLPVETDRKGTSVRLRVLGISSEPRYLCRLGVAKRALLA